MEMEARIKNYWTKRAHDFGLVRKNELENKIAARWLEELERHFPQNTALDILDVGTGTGFFALLLAQRGHRVHGVDLTEAMIQEAREQAAEFGVDAVFQEMDAQNLSYESERFDVILSRNLTWTLPDPEQAYREWFRVLRPGGLLLNYDAAYATHVQSESTQNNRVASDSPYGHVGVTRELEQENAAITLAMEIGREHRPEWDKQVLTRIGFTDCTADLEVGKRVLEAYDLETAPMFGIRAVKPGKRG